jgi:hypothetical protein
MLLPGQPPALAAGYRRARLSALAAGGAFGSGVGLGAVALAIASLSPVSMTASPTSPSLYA